MSAKPATQTTGPALATSQLAQDAPGRTVLAAAKLAPSGLSQAAHAGDQFMAAQPILLRLPMVMRITGLARSTIYKLISQNQFPVPIKLSTRAVAWLQSEIETWVSSRVRAH
jgi:prophage regulatory protein